MWAIGFADRLRLRPIPTGTTANYRIDVDEEEARSSAIIVASSTIGADTEIPWLHLRTRLPLSHDRGAAQVPHQEFNGT